MTDVTFCRLSSTLIARLILNLRDPKNVLLPGVHGVSASMESTSTGMYMGRLDPFLTLEQSDVVANNVIQGDHDDHLPSTGKY